MTDGLEGGISDPQSGKRCARCNRVYPLSQRLCQDDGNVLSLRDPYHLVGSTLADRYRIDALVGIGGMGAVYCAWHLAIDRRVAVKILQPNVAILDESMKLLFEREARTIGRLVHENVADVFDAGSTSDGIAYIAMEWLDGGTLEEALAAGRAFSLARTSDLLGQIALALAAAHAARIVHRDLKPSNVMLTQSPDGHERVKVVDFGIAKAMADSSITRSGVLGTPAYASPEQLRGEAVDIRSDVYSLGVMLYRMLTGVLPFDGSSLEDLIALKAHASPVPVRQLRPELPQSLADLLDRMLSGDRDERPDSALEVSVPFAEVVGSLRPDEAHEVPPIEPQECEARAQRNEWLARA